MKALEKLGIRQKDIHKVLLTLANWSDDEATGYDGMWYGYSQLSDETAIPETKLRAIMKLLKEKKITTYKPTYCDGELRGRGYFLREPYSGEEIKELSDE